MVRALRALLAIAMLALPAAVAGHFAKTLNHMMALAVVIGAGVSALGLALSYGPNLPAGATIVVLAGILYLLTAVVFRMRRRSRSSAA